MGLARPTNRLHKTNPSLEPQTQLSNHRQPNRQHHRSSSRARLHTTTDVAAQPTVFREIVGRSWPRYGDDVGVRELAADVWGDGVERGGSRVDGGGGEGVGVCC